jgi:hypothetical protein
MDTLARAKVKVSLTVTTVVDFSDDGYLGPRATITEHLERAKRDVLCCKFLIKHGSLEPKPVSANFVVTAVTIVPMED